MILYILLIITIFNMILLFIGAFSKNSDQFNKLLAMNMFGTKSIIFIILLSLWKQDFMYIDIAFIYVILNFVAMIAVLKYYSEGKIG